MYILLVQSGIKPAADVEVGPEDEEWFGSYLPRLKIRLRKSEIDEEHGSGVTFYFSKDASKAEALKALDEEVRRSTPGERLFEEMGSLYGIPGCCVHRFAGRVGASLPRVHPEELDYVYHVPCKADCRESLKLGRRIRAALERRDPETLVAWRNFVRGTIWPGNEDVGGTSLESLASDVRSCTLCPLAHARKEAVPGEGPSGARIMIIGEAPGREEDASGRPFVGRAGKILTSSLAWAGIRRDEVYISNVVKCRPPRNRPPERSEIEVCYNTYLSMQIRLLKPKAVLVLGKTAMRAVTGLRAFPRKHVIHSDDLDYVCTYHPAALIYNRRLTSVFNRDVARLKMY